MPGSRASDDVDARLAAITRDARAARPRPSRSVWILAAVVGVACAIAFVIVLVAEPAPTAATRPAAVVDSRGGFAAGLVVGGVAGVALGYAIARQRAGRHSSRKSP